MKKLFLLIIFFIAVNFVYAITLNNSVYKKQNLLPNNAIGFKSKPNGYLFDVDRDGNSDFISSGSGFIVYGTNLLYNKLVNPILTNLFPTTKMILSNNWPATSVCGVDKQNGNVFTIHRWTFNPSNKKLGGALIKTLQHRPTEYIIDPIPQSNVYAILGTENDFSGCTMLDFNGDNTQDYLIAGFTLYGISPWILTSTIQIVYGSLVTNVQSISNLNGTNGFSIIQTEKSIDSVIKIGDINGDSHEDIICNIDKTYILLGRTNKFPFAHATTEEVFDGTNGWALFDGGNYSALGDFNGDGLADFSSGTKIVFGSRKSLHGLTDVDGTNGIVFSYDDERNHGEPDYEPSENFGGPVGIGDINADGYADIIAGSYLDNGEYFNFPLNAFIIYGRPIWSEKIIKLKFDWFNAIRGFIVQDPPVAEPFPPWGGQHSGFGRVVGGKGDFNGDGYDDPLIGATSAEELYVFFGGESPAWPPALLEPIRLPDSQTGIWEYVSESNVKICGMKATNSAMYVFTNNIQLSEFKSDFGSRYFTNNITWQTDETIVLEYVCSNYLGNSANSTILTLQPIPEPIFIQLFMLLAINIFCRLKNPNWLND